LGGAVNTTWGEGDLCVAPDESYLVFSSNRPGGCGRNDLWVSFKSDEAGLGIGWAIPSILLGVALIALNAATFPVPPADGGLFDVGPFIGVFVMALAAWLTVLGSRARH
jgi:hypothetical protein